LLDNVFAPSPGNTALQSLLGNSSSNDTNGAASSVLLMFQSLPNGSSVNLTG
jgi:hypothetical protein